MENDATARAVEGDPCTIEAYLALGTVLAAHGQWGDAALSFEEAVRVVPESPALANGLGYALWMKRGSRRRWSATTGRSCSIPISFPRA